MSGAQSLSEHGHGPREGWHLSATTQVPSVEAGAGLRSGLSSTQPMPRSWQVPGEELRGPAMCSRLLSRPPGDPQLVSFQTEGPEATEHIRPEPPTRPWKGGRQSKLGLQRGSGRELWDPQTAFWTKSAMGDFEGHIPPLALEPGPEHGSEVTHLQNDGKLLGGVPILHAHREPHLEGGQLLSEERTVLWDRQGG